MLPKGSMTRTVSVHVASCPAGTVATLMPVPALVPTARLSTELVVSGGRAMTAPPVQPAADQP